MDNRGQVQRDGLETGFGGKFEQVLPMPEELMSQNRARGIGGRILTAQNEQNESARDDTEAYGAGWAELARDEAELAHPEDFVGRETEVQIAEGFQAEVANAHPELKFVQRAAKLGQEGIARATMAMADEIVSKSEYQPLELLRLRDQASADMRRSFPVPERMGDVA